MTTNYVKPEVLEIGTAEELILGLKPVEGIEDMGENTLPDGSLDD